MSKPANDGVTLPSTAKTPAPEPLAKLPPRISAAVPAAWVVPARQLRSPANSAVPQDPEAGGTQSATHSKRLPTMSKAPNLDLQLLREPVSTTADAATILQSVVPLSVPGSGVPAAAICHSALVRSRL